MIATVNTLYPILVEAPAAQGERFDWPRKLIPQSARLKIVRKVTFRDARSQKRQKNAWRRRWDKRSMVVVGPWPEAAAATQIPDLQQT